MSRALVVSSLVATLALSPALHAEETETKITPGIEVIAQYAFRRTTGDEGATKWFHQFDLPRAFVFVDGERGPVHGRVLVEGVRSAGDGALVGVGGDSVVLRVREAYAGYRPFEWLDLRFGLVPTFVVPTLDKAWRLRALGPVSAEERGLLSPADLGAQLRVKLPLEYGEVFLGFTNGEGYTSRELGRGKTSELGVAIHPVPGGAVAPLTFIAAFGVGATGTVQARADRATFGLHWIDKTVRGGASFTYAFGADDIGARRAYVADLGVRVEPIRHLLFAARASIWQRDTSVSGNKITSAQLAVGGTPDDALEGWLSFFLHAPGAEAQVAVPGSKYWEFRATAKVAF